MPDTVCPHEFLEFGPTIQRAALIDGSDTFVLLRLRVRCQGCWVYFSFRGLQSGQPNPDMPVTSADGYELRAPIAPRPGGTLALLQLAGVADHLRPPGES